MTPPNPHARPTPPLLTVAQVADRLALSTKSIRRRIAEGVLPVRRLGGALRISEADLRRYIDGDGAE